MNHLTQNSAQAQVVPAAAVKAGEVVAVKAGKIYGVAHAPIPAGATGVVDLAGTYELAKAAIALEAGDVARVGTDGTITTDTTGTFAIGIAAADADAAAATALVYFDGLTPAKA